MASTNLQNYVNDVRKYIKKHDGKADIKAVNALYQASLVAYNEEKDIPYALRCTGKSKTLLDEYIRRETGRSLWDVENYSVRNNQPLEEINLFYDMLKLESFENFESYMYLMERDRLPERRFYYPRRKTLHIVTQDLMDLENRKFKFYGLSLPARTGKSTLNIFFLSWIMMKRPNSHNAMGGHSGILAKGFYKELLNLVSSSEYNFIDIYSFWHPNHQCIKDKSAEDFTINLDEADRFSTVTCRGIDGTWTGAIDISADGYLYVDDLVRDREHSLSPSRMETTFQEYLNKMVDRKNDGARELMVGTLWNVSDPLERIRVKYEMNPDYRFRRIPALNENDESNFDYDYNGFSTQYYIEMRDRLDDAEWQAKYQQQPFVREGLLFPKEELRYFNGMLPDGERKVTAVCDPAFGGGDSLSMPVCCEIKDKGRFIIDWVFNRGTQKVTVPLIVDAIIRHYVTELTIEKNNGGMLLADSIKAEMQRRNCFHCKITLVSAPVKMSKEDKITGYSDFVKDNFIFLMPRSAVPQDDVNVTYRRSDEYQKAMEEMTMYSPQGKNPHDDAPDSITQLAMRYEEKINGEIDVIENPFGGLF